MPKERKYKGRNIFPCSYVENTRKGLKWYVESIHERTGIPYGEQNSPKFCSIKAARDYIEENNTWAAAAQDVASVLTAGVIPPSKL